MAAVETFQQSTSSEDVVASLKQALKASGRNYFCLNAMPKQDQDFAKAIMAFELPPGWLEHYLRNDYASVDPALRQCKKTVLPFSYRAAPYDPLLEPKAAEVVNRAREFGVWNGTVFPIAGKNGCAGDLWISGTDQPGPEKDLPAINTMALYAFYKIQEFSSPKPCAKSPLSDREREVLQWIASGKTAWEIGQLLHISQRTVEWHVQQVVHKLGVKNRMQAIVVAARDHLIEI